MFVRAERSHSMGVAGIVLGGVPDGGNGPPQPQLNGGLRGINTSSRRFFYRLWDVEHEVTSGLRFALDLHLTRMGIDHALDQG